MGHQTGFLDHSRETEFLEQPVKRIRHYREFADKLARKTAINQSARCMDCGTPFCQSNHGCPLHNSIPEWNDLVYKGDMHSALVRLHSTNNFPEFTGRLCPAPCEDACVLNINKEPVSIRAIERYIIDYGFDQGWIRPQIPDVDTGYKVAIVGSGPAGLTCAQQLRRAGHSVVVYEKNDQVGGLLRFGIPDFRLSKDILDRRLLQLHDEGIRFIVNTEIGRDLDWATLKEKYHAVILAGGCEQPRDIDVPGRSAGNVYYAMDFLTDSNRFVSGASIEHSIGAAGKDIVIIGGGETGHDCAGVASRQGASSVLQIQIHEKSQTHVKPAWPASAPAKFKFDHEVEPLTNKVWGIGTSRFQVAGCGRVNSVVGHKVVIKDQEGRRTVVGDAEQQFVFPADLVLIAIGFEKPRRQGLLESLAPYGLSFDDRGRIMTGFSSYSYKNKRRFLQFATTIPGLFTCGDMRTGQSLIVTAISEGRRCAAEVHNYLLQAKDPTQ